MLDVYTWEEPNYISCMRFQTCSVASTSLSKDSFQPMPGQEAILWIAVYSVQNIPRETVLMDWQECELYPTRVQMKKQMERRHIHKQSKLSCHQRNQT